MKKSIYAMMLKKIKAINLKKISLTTKLTIIGVLVLFAIMLVSIKTNIDKTPRIMYWPGKVNQHFDLKNKMWSTDLDAVSGSGMDMLTYCQKYYPKTIKVTPYKDETINTWRSVGNEGQYAATKMSYSCMSK